MKVGDGNETCRSLLRVGGQPTPDPLLSFDPEISTPASRRSCVTVRAEPRAGAGEASHGLCPLDYSLAPRRSRKPPWRTYGPSFGSCKAALGRRAVARVWQCPNAVSYTHLADAFPTVLVPALAAMAGRRGIAGPLPIDAIKLSHHGSRANVTQDLLRAVDARHFVFSTNNSYFQHPNAEAVARVIVGGGKPTLWFNYDTPSNRQWGAPELMARHGHVARYPKADAGVTIELSARRLARPA